MTSVLFIMSLCVVFWYSYGMLLSALRVCVCVCVCVCEVNVLYYR